MSARRLVAFVLAGAASLAPRALAAEPKAPQPVAQAPLEIHAEHLDLDLEAKSATMTGHVKITKGGLELRCPRVDVRYDQVPHVTWVRGTGGVVAEVKGVRAEAPEVELDVAAQALTLKGGVKVTRGEGWLTAERATVQIATGKVSMTDVKGSLPVGSAEPPR
jgi:lipopolysaccharide export system protein LptA